VLRRIQSLSYEEISRVLGCEMQPLKVRVHRAFLKLQKAVIRMTQETRS
jgi:DNA-directed RNA polymerase specialized sigma24 family protein